MEILRREKGAAPWTTDGEPATVRLMVTGSHDRGARRQPLDPRGQPQVLAGGEPETVRGQEQGP